MIFGCPCRNFKHIILYEHTYAQTDKRPAKNSIRLLFFIIQKIRIDARNRQINLAGNLSIDLYGFQSKQKAFFLIGFYFNAMPAGNLQQAAGSIALGISLHHRRT